MSYREAGPEHECRAARRCKARVRDDEGAWHGVGVERPNTLCRACEADAFAAIRDLPDDYRLLSAARTGPRSRQLQQRVAGTMERPIPIRLPIDTLQSDIDVEATRWAARLPGDDPAGVLECLALVGRTLGTLVDLPPQEVTVWVPHPDGGDSWGRTVLDGVDAVQRLAALHRRAVRLLGLEPDRDERLHDACHVCGLQALTVSVRTRLITCRACRNVWDETVFARLNDPLAA
ncbi:hypothetical protein [Nocardia puris]|uniref:Uncharacterized protein n=1 Tax=Nocardia puris TaxID=208602 RepID=A0A366CYM1_9NOCA|nr:hypothetical protein [Nocardia puris]RBO82088.1 hypothetical protein DFR74_12543 [Nocardia puris]